MKVLITGAHGQLGNELQRVFRDGRSEIGAIPSVYEHVIVLETDANKLDITDAPSVIDFVQREKPDVIINCAAMTNVDGCEANESDAYRVNAEAAGNLATAAAATGAKMVQVSTDYVFAGNHWTDRVENDATDPQSAYGRTKLAGERLVAEKCAKHFIVRTAWLYGYVGNNFVKTILRLARENGRINVVYDQFGNPTSANDLAYEIAIIAATEDYGIYHCTNNGTCSWCDFACAIVDEAGIACLKNPCTTEGFPRPAHRPEYSSLRNKRLEDTVGDEMRPWRDALKDYMQHLAELEG